MQRPTNGEQGPRPGQTGQISVPHPDLEWKEVVKGQRPADVRVRIATHRNFRRVGPDMYLPKAGATQPKTVSGRLWSGVKRFVIGSPIASASEGSERVGRIQGLALFSSDALSSVAYATEEIMRVLVLAGSAALSLTLPTSLAIIALLLLVVLSYQQTIRAYPQGGGSYLVASENLGLVPGLTAAGSLMLDYVLTVAVSAAAGIAALTSAFPSLFALRVELTIGAIVVLALLNLRGIRESGNIFAIPTYVFMVVMLILIGIGMFVLFFGSPPPAPQYATEGEFQYLSLFLILAAFAQGCTAMTGVEAVSNGVPSFKPPESKHAAQVLVGMGIVLAILFSGISFLAVHLGITPDPAEQETVVSQIARLVVGIGPFYYVIQFATALILILAANTSYNGFPRLASILAHDKVLPNQFGFRGDRLAFTVGILALTAAACALVWVFGGSLSALIPLYAIGVFTSFTLSQAGMVVHWRRERGPRWQSSIVINGIGAATTFVVTLIIAATKFTHGAWMVIVLNVVFIFMFLAIRRHYLHTRQELQAVPGGVPPIKRIRAIVPIAGLNFPAQEAIAMAQAITSQATAVHVTDDVEAAEKLRQDWNEHYPGIPLVIVESPFRQLLAPLLAYIDAVREQHPDDTVTVVLPEFVTAHWWELALHNQTAVRLKAALQFRPGIVLMSVPVHLPSRRESADVAASGALAALTRESEEEASRQRGEEPERAASLDGSGEVPARREPRIVRQRPPATNDAKGSAGAKPDEPGGPASSAPLSED